MVSKSDIDFDIIIVGGGMVGTSMACQLGDLPVKVGLVDRVQPDFSDIPYRQTEIKFDARVSALTAASGGLLDRLGAWPEITEQRCCHYLDMDVWDADGTGSIHFSAKEIRQPKLGTIVENSLISAALYDRLATLDNIQILAPLSIEDVTAGDRAVLKTSDGQELSAKLLIAADGANSRIREIMGFKTREWDYQHKAIVTTVRTELPHERKALQRFMATGPLAFLPLSSGQDSDDQHYCSIVWSAVPGRCDELMAMDDDVFASEIAASIEHRLGNIEWLDKRFAFSLRQRHAIDYVKDNVVLIGDAAHTIHPLAGQGVNLGFLDTVALAAELERALQAGRELSDPVVLKRYQRQRIGNNLGMMSLMEGFKHLFANEALPVRWLRNIGMSGVDNLGMVKNELARRAMGLN